MTEIATLTMNPAMDVSTSTDRIEPLRKLRCTEERRDPGGGGINVARVARRLGAHVRAIYPAGGFAGGRLQALVGREGVASIPVPVAGETREDFTVLDVARDEQYRFVLPGPHLTYLEWRACLDAVAELDPKPAYFCASGSLPPGPPEDFWARAAQIVSGWGGRFVLDASGAGLARALEAGVYLVKPNLRELSELTGRSLETAEARVGACRDLIGRGAASVVALSLGEEGAMCVSADLALTAAALPVHAVSTVGAGDCFLGAMVWALAEDKPVEDAFRWAMAGGSAAVLAEGTALCRAEDVRRLYADVVVEPILQA